MPTRTRARHRTSGDRTAELLAPCFVVGYDGSEGARAAVDWAVRTLPRHGQFVLVYACRAQHALPSPLTPSAERRELAHATFDELALDADDTFLARATHTEVADKDPAAALVDAAIRYAASMIVVGRQQHSRLHRAIGTSTGELLMRSPVPVTVVPPLAS
jgi:nucleotide-binding universal stress UspA family protein